MTTPIRNTTAAISALIILQTVMLLSLYTQTFPHPPEVVAPFGIAPFLGASLAVAAAALLIGPIQNNLGRGLSVLTAICALVSYGPQKYFDAQFGAIWPSIIAGQIAVLCLLTWVWKSRGTAQ